MPNDASPVLIRLTKIKQWYLPVDVESYNVLKNLGVPMLRIHQNFLETLGLLTKQNNVKAKSVDFQTEIFDPFIEKYSAIWAKKYGTVEINSKSLIFKSKDAQLPLAKEKIANLEDKLRSFFDRWGYKSTFVYSENRQGTRMKLHVDYWYDSDKMPVLQLETPHVDLKEVQLKLGFTRLTFRFDDFDSKTESGNDLSKHKIGYVHLLVEISQGGKFVPLHTSKCLYSQISSVLPLIKALMNIPNRDSFNLENESK